MRVVFTLKLLLTPNILCVMSTSSTTSARAAAPSITISNDNRDKWSQTTSQRHVLIDQIPRYLVFYISVGCVPRARVSCQNKR